MRVRDTHKVTPQAWTLSAFQAMFWVLGMGDKTRDCPTELSAPSLPAPLTATPPPTGSQALVIVDSGHLGYPLSSGHFGDVTRVFHAELCPSLQY